MRGTSANGEKILTPTSPGVPGERIGGHRLPNKKNAIPLDFFPRLRLCAFASSLFRAARFWLRPGSVLGPLRSVITNNPFVLKKRGYRAEYH